MGGGVFVHVLANLEDVRDNYIAVEPSLVDAQDSTLDEIELRLADSAGFLFGTIFFNGNSGSLSWKQWLCVP